MSEYIPGWMVLDTHAWIWLFQGHPRLRSSGVMEALNLGIANRTLKVAAISLWEVAMLESKGRITLGIPCEEWLQHATTASGISVAPLSLEVALESCRLSKEFHADPSDRIIVATARVLGATLVTADQKIIDFGKGKLLNVFPV